MIKVILLLALIYVLNVIDYVQTTLAIQQCGTGVELNPVVCFLFEHDCLWALKMIMPAILLTTLGFIIKTEKKYIWTVYFMLALYSIVVIHNFVTLSYIGVF